MTTALAVSTPRLTPDVFHMINQVAPTVHNARLFGTASADQAAAIMIKGYELGFSLTASFENIHVIEGKPSLSPKGALALIYNSPECAGVSIKDEVDDKGVPMACTVTMKRRNGLEYTARYSMDDARRADVVKPKSGWEKYPANMLRWRAIGYAADVVFPDVIGGTKRADEFGADISPDGDIIEGSWTIAQSGSQPPAATIANPGHVTGLYSGHPDADKGVSLQDLLSKYTAAQIMAANNGRIPGTDEECAAVAKTLEGELGAESE